MARVLGLKFVFASSQGGAPPTSEASEYKLFTTEYSRRLANASMDIAGPGGQLRVRDEDAPMAGRAESTYRYTVIDTIGGGASEIQKNIIARRKLGLPEELLIAVPTDRDRTHPPPCRRAADGRPPADGPGTAGRDHRARPGQRGPGGPVHPAPGRLRGHRGQGGGGARAAAPSPSSRRSTPTAARATCSAPPST